MRDLATRASEIGKELFETLKRSQTGEKKSKFKAFKATARSRWDQDDIKKIEERLNNIQNALQLRVVVEIKRKIDGLPDEKLHEGLDLLEKVLDVQSRSGDDVRRALASLDRNEKSGESHHEELVASLNEIKTLTSIRSPSPLPGHPRISGLEFERVKSNAETAVLNSLWYPGMHDREDTISNAYGKTLDWLYKDPRASDKPWDSFVDFLQGDKKVYWISGKPGCGKSTVMKYLKEDKRTSEHLQVWAAGRELRFASFYFFYNGPERQKSEQGLLDSLLHTLLCQDRSLIPIVFKEQYDALINTSSAMVTSPSVPEAKRALNRLFRIRQDIRYFLTIDGLDEFDPNVSLSNVTSLLNITETFAEFPNIKIVLSRPSRAQV